MLSSRINSSPPPDILATVSHLLAVSQGRGLDIAGAGINKADYKGKDDNTFLVSADGATCLN